jgi:cytochrome c oxidase assembly factor CtaG
MSDFFRNSWDWDLSKIIGCAALVLIYGVWTRFKPLRSALFYLSGVTALFLSLASPLDALGDEYLFSAHMLQHFILLMVVPLLLILGLPEAPVRALLRIGWIKRTEEALSQPVFAWMLANSILWGWHLPSLYVFAVRNEGVHIFQHLTFLISSTIFWWPILAPTEESRLVSWDGFVYLFTAALSNMALGIVFTFVNEPLFSPYVAPEDSWKILSVIRNQFHLDPVADQKLGGILMWVLGSSVFLGVFLFHYGRWYSATELEGT